MDKERRRVENKKIEKWHRQFNITYLTGIDIFIPMMHPRYERIITKL